MLRNIKQATTSTETNNWIQWIGDKKQLVVAQWLMLSKTSKEV